MAGPAPVLKNQTGFAEKKPGPLAGTDTVWQNREDRSAPFMSSMVCARREWADAVKMIFRIRLFRSFFLTIRLALFFQAQHSKKNL